MRGIFVIFTLLCAFHSQAQSPQFAQFPLEEYVTQFLVEEGALVSNIQFTGDMDQLGYSYDTQDVGYGWPWDEAFILSSTWAEAGANTNWVSPFAIDAYTNPAFDGPKTFADGGVYSDLLNLSNECNNLLGAINEEGDPIVNDEIFDVSAIEFDIVPTNDTLVFRYNLAGNELYRSGGCYPTPYGYSYALCEYNDIFGIFVSGPGISGEYDSPLDYPDGSINVAHVPGTDPLLPMCTTAINDSTNTQYYVPYCDLVEDTTILGFCELDMNFIAFTTLIEHHVPVTCGQTYHIRFAIGDVFDHIYSTHAYIGVIGGTGNAGYNPTVNFSFQPLGEPTTNVFEDCDPAYLNVIRAETSDLAVADTILIFQEGEALMLDDFSLIPDTVIIPAFETSVSIEVDIIDDGLAEIEEQLILSILPASFDELSCASYADISILDQAEPLLAFGENVILCDSLEAVLTPEIDGGYGQYTYLWSTGDTDSELVLEEPDPSLEYFVVVGDTCGMAPDTAWFTMEAVTELTANIAPDSIAFGCVVSIPISVEVTGGYGEVDYAWNPFGSNAADIEYNSTFGPGTITVVVEDECGTLATDSVIVFLEDAEPFAYTGPETINGGCQGLAVIDANTTGGFGPYQYVWVTPGGTMSGETIEVPFEESAIVTLVATDACGQLIIQMMTITDELDPITMQLPADVEGTCAEIFNFPTSFEGGHAPFSFSWIIDGELVSTDSLLLDLQFEADAIVELTVEDACGQTLTDSFTFELISTPISISAIPDVEGSCFELVDLLAIAEGGDGELSYEWLSNGELLGDDLLILFTLEPGMEEIILNVTDECGQLESMVIGTQYTGSSLLVDLVDELQAECLEIFVIEAEFEGQVGDVNFTWQVDGIDLPDTDSSIEISMNTSGTVVVTASDDCQAMVSDEVFVNITAESLLSQDVFIELCQPDSIEITAVTEGGTGELIYNWPFGEGTDTETLFISGEQILYVQVTDVCDQSTTISVEIDFVEPEVSILPQHIGPGQWLFSADPLCSTCEYQWDFGDGNSINGQEVFYEFDLGADQLVNLTFINEQGCLAEATHIIEGESSLFIPNAFTPDNDGINDVFSVTANGFAEYSIGIYDRWGELVFQSEDPHEVWVGNHQDGDYFVPNGMYVYIVRVIDQSNVPLTKTGWITLLR